MVSIRIYKCKDLKKRELIRKCSNYFIKELLPNKKKLKVKIIFDDILFKTYGMLGSCLADDDATNKRHYEFTVRLDSNMCEHDTLSILAHELAHVKQYAIGQLLYDTKCSTNSIWEGKIYDDSKIHYDKHPWEKDAVKYEKLLVKLLLKSNILK